MNKMFVKGLFYAVCLIFGHSHNAAHAQSSDIQNYNNHNESEEFKVASCAFDNNNNNNNNHSQVISGVRNAMNLY